MADVLSPPMGSGQFPSDDYHSVAFMQLVKIVDFNYKLVAFIKKKNYKLVEIIDGTMSGNTDNSKCYDLHYFGFQGEIMGQTFSFGGPGGDCGT